jgi:hypothetical protein
MILSGVDFTAGTFTPNPVADTLVSKITDSLTSPFMGANEVMDAPGVFVNDVVWGVGGSIVGGIVARKRSMKEPYLGFLY